jgi:hypothetical protein
MLKNLPIPVLQDVPTCQYGHLHEEWFSNTGPSRKLCKGHYNETNKSANKPNTLNMIFFFINAPCINMILLDTRHCECHCLHSVPSCQRIYRIHMARRFFFHSVAYATDFLNVFFTYFKMLKNSERKFSMYISIFYVLAKLFHEKSKFGAKSNFS